MLKMQLMEKGKWQPSAALLMPRKGQVFRVEEGPQQWSGPRIALGCTWEDHPKNPGEKILSVLYKEGEYMGRFLRAQRPDTIVRES